MKTLKEFKKKYNKHDLVIIEYKNRKVEMFFTRGIEDRIITSNKEDLWIINEMLDEFTDIKSKQLLLKESRIGCYKKYYYKNNRHAITLYLYN